MSSRNVRLTAEGRRKAPALYAAMLAAAREVRSGVPADEAIARAVRAVMSEGFESVEYIELRDAETLGPVAGDGRPARMLAAAWLDGVRLIDNIAV